MKAIHLDEARVIAIRELRTQISRHPEVRVLLIEDVFGRFRIQISREKDFYRKKNSKDESSFSEQELAKSLHSLVGQYWADDMLVTIANADSEEARYFLELWNEGVPDEVQPDGIRIVLRSRTRGGWVVKPNLDPPWPCLKPTPKSPAIVAFFSYKGGVGRSTALAGFALQRAKKGEKVCIVDCDLDAPGIGALFSSSDGGIAKPWGVVDALIEAQYPEIPLSDYSFTYLSSQSPIRGEVIVFPAGKIERAYLGKLSRVDLEPSIDSSEEGVVHKFIRRIGEQIKPHWLLLDVRAGLSEITGAIFSGLAHLNVLFSTASGQSLDGLKIFVERLGKERLLVGKASQGDCLVVHAMIPRNPSTAAEFRKRFEGAVQDIFENSYYLPESGESSPQSSEFSIENEAWTIDDMESAYAPHKPVSISYDEKLAGLLSLSEVEGALTEGEYGVLGNRITAFFKVPA